MSEMNPTVCACKGGSYEEFDAMTLGLVHFCGPLEIVQWWCRPL